jgi:hypothetical protein
MCACGKQAPVQAMTSAEVNALLENARIQAQEAMQSEMESMTASIQQAAANASSGTSALR